jgi:hypothetical protein
MQPGFTAEVSLQQANTFIQSTQRYGAEVDRPVLAQLRVIGNPINTCYSRCFLNGGSPLQCFFACGPGQLSGLAGQLSAGILA